MALTALRRLRPGRSSLAREKRRAFLRLLPQEDDGLAEAFEKVQLQRRRPARARPLHRV